MPILKKQPCENKTVVTVLSKLADISQYFEFYIWNLEDDRPTKALFKQENVPFGVQYITI